MLRLLLLFHRWVALTTGVIIVVLAVTGSLITVQLPLDRLLRPALWHASVGQALPLDTLVARVHVALPDASVSWIVLPTGPGRATLLGTHADQQVWMDGVSGTVNGIRTGAELRRSPTAIVRMLHGSLGVPKAGHPLVLVGTITTLLLSLSGLWLWWPDKLWRIRGGSWKRVVFDLHHLLGITGLAVFVVMAATGVILGARLVNRFADRGTAGPAPARQPAVAEGTQPASLDAIARAARGAVPGNDIRLVSIPRDPAQPVVLTLRPPGGRMEQPPSRVTVDRYRAAVLHVQAPGDYPSADRIGTWLFALHTGEFGGLPAVTIWAVASLALAVNAVTGLLMWWNGRAARRALERAAAAKT